MVHLPLRNKAQAQQLSRDQGNPKSPLYHKWLTPAQFAARFGPLQSDVAAAAGALHAGGFTIDRTDMTMVLAHAPSATVERFFGTRLGLVRDVTSSALKIDARTPVIVPASLARLNASVLQLTAMPRPHSTMEVRKGASLQIAGKNAKIVPHPNARFGAIGPYLPGELYQAYGQPAQTYANGKGETIDIVGLSDTTNTENQTFWCYEGLGAGCGSGGTTLGAYPTVNHYVSGVPSGCIPADTNGDSVEAALDIQMAGGTAPGATFNTFCSNSLANWPFLDAYSYITTFSSATSLRRRIRSARKRSRPIRRSIPISRRTTISSSKVSIRARPSCSRPAITARTAASTKAIRRTRTRARWPRTRT